MGCSASAVLLEGLRSVLERNCAYVKGPAAGGASRGEEEEEGGRGGAETLSNPRGTHPWIPTAAPVTSQTSRMPPTTTLVVTPPASPRFFLQFFILVFSSVFHCLIIVLKSPSMSLCSVKCICVQFHSIQCKSEVSVFKIRYQRKLRFTSFHTA